MPRNERARCAISRRRCRRISPMRATRRLRRGPCSRSRRRRPRRRFPLSDPLVRPSVRAVSHRKVLMPLVSGRASFLAALIGLALVVATPARAIPFTLEVFADGVLIGEVDSTRLGCVDDPDGTSAQCHAQGLEYGTDYPLLAVDSDIAIDSQNARITGTAGVTNLWTDNQQITLRFTLPIAPIPGGTLSGGSIGGVVIDNGVDGATLSAPAESAFYTAQIDGGNWQSLYLDPPSIEADGMGSAEIPDGS